MSDHVELVDQIKAEQRRMERGRNIRTLALVVTGLIIASAMAMNGWATFRHNGLLAERIHNSNEAVRNGNEVTRQNHCLAERLNYTQQLILAHIDSGHFRIERFMQELAAALGVSLPIDGKVVIHKAPPPPVRPKCGLGPIKTRVQKLPRSQRTVSARATTSRGAGAPAQQDSHPAPAPQPSDRPTPHPTPTHTPKPQRTCLPHPRPVPKVCL